MDSLRLILHTPKNPNHAIGEDGTYYFRHGEIVRALLVNSRANASKIKHDIEYEAYDVPVMANELAMLPMDYYFNERVYFNNGKKKVKRGQYGVFNVPSSEYNVGYFVDPDREMIHINVSIPKYLYGHSVAQVIEHSHKGVNIHHDTWDTWNKVTDKWYKLLKKFIKDFFRYTFAGCEIDYKYVEISGIDLAFNQYFDSREQALRVAHYMAGKKVSRIRGEGSKKEAYEEDYLTNEVTSTGFYTVQKNYYFKVYHKGIEFRKNQYKELMKHNEKVSKNHRFAKKLNSQIIGSPSELLNPKMVGFDCMALQEEADKILRHELRFYPRSMSHLYKTKVFRKGVKKWESDKKEFRRLENLRVSYKRAFDEGIEIKHINDYLKEKHLLRYGITKKFVSWNKTTKKRHADLQSIMQKRHRFFLEVDDCIKEHGKKDTPWQHENYYREAHFSKELFQEMIRKFRWYIKAVQVTESPTEFALEQRVNEHNETCHFKNDKISLSMVKRAYDLIQKHGSLDHAEEKGDLKRSSKYNMRNALKVLGVNDTKVTEPIPVDISFQTYLQKFYSFEKDYQDIYFPTTKYRHKKEF